VSFGRVLAACSFATSATSGCRLLQRDVVGTEERVWFRPLNLVALSEPVFVDAPAWIAITNREDRNHRKADRIFQRLLNSPTLLITTNWTAYEALTLVKSRPAFDQAGRS